MEKIAPYPELSEVTLALRDGLSAMLGRVDSGISEFTFANIYLFRKAHNYRVSIIGESVLLITGRDGDSPFFMLPAGFPKKDMLDRLFGEFSSMKCLSASQARALSRTGYPVKEDRDNFDYLYSRRELATFSGRKFHRKKNLVNQFTSSCRHEIRPLLADNLSDAALVLDKWRRGSASDDYEAAKEALERYGELKLCGWAYYADDTPVAYTMGEELRSDTFVVHFEKGIEGYKGLLQFVTQSSSALLPERYEFINREQDLGEEGLRKAKESLRPIGFIKKYRACRETKGPS